MIIRAFPYIVLSLAILFNSLANVALKFPTKTGALEPATTFKMIRIIFLNKFFFLGIFLFGLNFLAYTLSLRSLRLSTAYPILIGGSVVLITILSIVWLKESFSFLQVAGIIFILAGIALLNI